MVSVQDRVMFISIPTFHSLSYIINLLNPSMPLLEPHHSLRHLPRPTHRHLMPRLQHDRLQIRLPAQHPLRIDPHLVRDHDRIRLPQH